MNNNPLDLDFAISRNTHSLPRATPYRTMNSSNNGHGWMWWFSVVFAGFLAADIANQIINGVLAGLMMHK